MSKSALAITEEHTDLADSAIGQLNRLNSRAAARATLENGSAHPSEIWSAGKDLGWNGLAIAEEHGGSGFGLAELARVAETELREGVPVNPERIDDLALAVQEVSAFIGERLDRADAA